MSVSPYLYYEDAAAALDWLARAFGFEELVRYVDADGVVHEAEMAAGETTIMLNGASPGYWRERGGGGPAGSALVVYVDDVDATPRARDRRGRRGARAGRPALRRACLRSHRPRGASVVLLAAPARRGRAPGGLAGGARQDASATRSFRAGASTGIGSSGLVVTMARSMSCAGRWNM